MPPSGAGDAARPRPAPDRGSASLWLLAVGIVLVLAGMTGAGLGAAMVASHRAQAAADLGALAGAPHVNGMGPAACEVAAGIAEANGGRLTACRVDGLDLLVTVRVPVVVAGHTLSATATARAGPVQMSGPVRMS